MVSHPLFWLSKRKNGVLLDSSSRWRGSLRVVSRVGITAFGLIAPSVAHGAIVSQAVVEAADAARLAARPGSLKDRIITDHIALVTTVLREKQLAQYRAIRNIVLITLGLGLCVVAWFRVVNERAEKRLREQEVELFGEFRSASTEVIDEDEDDDDDDPPPPRSKSNSSGPPEDSPPPKKPQTPKKDDD